MRERYEERPQRTWLEVLNEKPGAECILHFVEDIEEISEPDQDGILKKSYEADVYSLTTGYREGLLKEVEDNRSVWLAAAMNEDAKAENKTLKTRVRDLEQVTDDIIISMLEG